MAVIDKTYVTWKQYLELKEWCDNTVLIYDNGVIGSPIDFLFSYTESFEGEKPCWNTSEGFDRWLYFNCPLSFIQERLTEQYSENYFNSDKKPYKRGSNYKQITYPKIKFCNKNTWFIDIVGQASNGEYWYCGWNSNIWYPSSALMPPETICSCYTTKNLTKRKLNRLIKKWRLPVGTILEISNRWIGSNYKIMIK